MKRNTIRLTESQLHRIIKESVQTILENGEDEGLVWNGIKGIGKGIRNSVSNVYNGMAADYYKGAAEGNGQQVQQLQGQIQQLQDGKEQQMQAAANQKGQEIDGQIQQLQQQLNQLNNQTSGYQNKYNSHVQKLNNNDTSGYGRSQNVYRQQY